MIGRSNRQVRKTTKLKKCKLHKISIISSRSIQLYRRKANFTIMNRWERKANFAIITDINPPEPYSYIE